MFFIFEWDQYLGELCVKGNFSLPGLVQGKYKFPGEMLILGTILFSGDSSSGEALL